MRNCLRCCISCILPCGALDVIRIVHSNGRVEEISGTIKASDVMKAHPKHVLKKPCSSAAVDAAGCGGVHKIVVVPPDAELQRGKIYFLMPLPPPPPPLEKNMNQQRRKKKKEHRERSRNNSNTNVSMTMTSFLVSDRYLTDILSEKVSTQRDRRRGRVAVWRPHLESISESPSHL
ncbi:uncharacterized protein LOC109788246 [Cajanus cajan]|uniref:Uncharacterized protein n=1 Tax=Cajanus cajan TaxID=3821 RepID=A0A151RCA8_CAJCA|nr:uncharacterized protein LOC109788246 [Cajanus cajan]KYP40099.1 hypothetical protein KK1_038582 [Cajanus cajan]